MPARKDLKRLVRSRMQKTGESYTTARRHVLAKAKPKAPEATTLTGPAGSVAGMSDAAVQSKTGRTWAQWCEFLDHDGATAMSHRDIARRLRERDGLSPWWSQTVTVGYERLRGRRAVHQRAGGFAVTKTRTFAVPLAQLAAAFTPSARTQWLADEATHARKSVAGKVTRWTRTDGSKVDVNFWPKGAGKAQAQLQHDGLADADQVARWRRYWSERFDALAAWLADVGAAK